MRITRMTLGTLAALALALPALAAEGEAAVPFFSLRNPPLIVIISFLIFVGVLIYMKVPGRLTSMLDVRAANIRRELDEARKLREEAQAMVASYERKAKEAEAQVERIIATARTEAQAAADKAKSDLKGSIARRLAAADEQIASAQAAAVREVKNQAAEIAIAAAGDLLAKGMTAAQGNALIDDAIQTVEARLH